MNRAEIVAALTALGAVLDSRGLRGEMYVVGGAAIALAFDARRSTRDIDAVFEPKAAIYEAAAEVSQRLELPPGWLNDAVKGFLAGELGLTSAAEVLAVAEQVFGDRLDAAAQFFVEELFADAPPERP